jgi:hypothetical protein
MQAHQNATRQAKGISSVPVMIVESSYDSTAQTDASWPFSSVDSSPHLPTCHTRASVSQLPLMISFPSALASNAHTFEPWPNRSASASSSKALLGPRTSMIWSLPLDTMRPSGKASEGGTIAKELTNSFPWVLMVQSYVGGVADCCFHNRTVASRDAETTVVGWGNATLRTWRGRRGQYRVYKEDKGFSVCGGVPNNAHRLRGLAARQRAYSRPWLSAGLLTE